MPAGRGYVGVFSPAGKLIAYSDTPELVRHVAGKVAEELPQKAPDKESGILLVARRRALRAIASDRSGE